MQVTSQLYGQFLTISQTNFTGTYFADSLEGLNHNSVYRFLRDSRILPSFVWEKISGVIEYSPRGYVIFDDTVLDKNFSFDIESVRSQYSGNAHGVVKGIGVVTCIYFNPDTQKYYPLDFRLFAPDTDGKTKLTHVEDMLRSIIHRSIPFQTVLMDTWYATTDLMRFIGDDLKKIYYCPLKSNRLVDDSGGREKYKNVDALSWNDIELQQGKIVKVQKFPQDQKLKLFRVPVSTNRTDHVVTNDMAQDSTEDTRKECAIRWKIEEFHRELKQLTGIEKCQARLERSQRNHICLSILSWICMKTAAWANNVTIYEQKKRPLLAFMAEQWRDPATLFCL